jgi:hypothetical protein
MKRNSEKVKEAIDHVVDSMGLEPAARQGIYDVVDEMKGVEVFTMDHAAKLNGLGLPASQMLVDEDNNLPEMSGEEAVNKLLTGLDKNFKKAEKEESK